MHPNSQPGFTIVELLAVAAVIAILAAFVLGGVKSALESGKKAQCQSQLKQLYLAITMYSNDNGRIFPNINNDDPTGSSAGFMHFLGSYLENPKVSIFQCTNASSQSDADSYYLFNEQFNDPANKPAGLDKLSLKLGNPVSQIDIFTCRSGWKNGVKVQYFPHTSGVNVLFGDGRVVFVHK